MLGLTVTCRGFSCLALGFTIGIRVAASGTRNEKAPHGCQRYRTMGRLSGVAWPTGKEKLTVRQLERYHSNVIPTRRRTRP